MKNTMAGSEKADRSSGVVTCRYAKKTKNKSANTQTVPIYQSERST
jgi:hypothetical protein